MLSAAMAIESGERTHTIEVAAEPHGNNTCGTDDKQNKLKLKRKPLQVAMLPPNALLVFDSVH
jgi:hypothetical protein